MPSVAIIGANGQLGSDCERAFSDAGYAVTRLNHAELDIAERGAVHRRMVELGADVVINTAAMHNVEACEGDPAAAHRINGIGARNIALATRATGARLLHISTDYVFDGRKRSPYSETDDTGPLNVYGNSKLSGEQYVLAEAPNAAVVRTSALYGVAPCRAKGGLNFVQLMLKLARERGEVKVVKDEMVSPTCALDLARQLVILAEDKGVGVFHASSRGECSWHAFAAEIFALTGTAVRLLEASATDFPAKVRRPSYSVLENVRLMADGLDRMQPWRDSLRAYLAEIGKLADRPSPIYATG